MIARRIKAGSLRAALIVVSVLAAAGCGKREPDAASAPAPPPAPAKQSVENLISPAPAPPAPAPASTGTPATDAAQNSDVTVEVANLTIELRIFVSQKKRFPSDLNELSRASGLKIPVPPKGNHLVIDKESRSVKMAGGN
jgi:hypothetical protein